MSSDHCEQRIKELEIENLDLMEKIGEQNLIIFHFHEALEIIKEEECAIKYRHKGCLHPHTDTDEHDCLGCMRHSNCSAIYTIKRANSFIHEMHLLFEQIEGGFHNHGRNEKR